MRVPKIPLPRFLTSLHPQANTIFLPSSSLSCSISANNAQFPLAHRAIESYRHSNNRAFRSWDIILGAQAWLARVVKVQRLRIASREDEWYRRSRNRSTLRRNAGSSRIPRDTDPWNEIVDTAMIISHTCARSVAFRFRKRANHLFRRKPSEWKRLTCKSREYLRSRNLGGDRRAWIIRDGSRSQSINRSC